MLLFFPARIFKTIFGQFNPVGPHIQVIFISTAVDLKPGFEKIFAAPVEGGISPPVLISPKRRRTAGFAA
jgi:hypothetical protein